MGVATNKRVAHNPEDVPHNLTLDVGECGQLKECGSIEDGFGTAHIQQTGLDMKTVAKNNELCGAKRCPDFVKPGVGSILPIVEKLGLGMSDLTKGVAKSGKLSMQMDSENVILRTADSMRMTSAPPPPQPKTPAFKSKTKPSKISLPDWLGKWQK